MFIAPLSSDTLTVNVTAHMKPGPLPLSRLSDAIAQQLGIDIVRGFYGVGQALPTETSLASRWNVSRTAVREGLRALASKGLLETRTKTGTTVRRRAQWNLLDPDILAWMRQTQPDKAFVRSLIELRLIIEPQAAALTARRRSADDIAELQRLLVIMAAPNRPEEAARRADVQFHRTLLLAAGNHVLAPLAASIEAAVAWANAYKAGQGIFVRDSVIDHQRLLDALIEGNDKEARWWAEVLIRSGIEPLVTRSRV